MQTFPNTSKPASENYIDSDLTCGVPSFSHADGEAVVATTVTGYFCGWLNMYRKGSVRPTFLGAKVVLIEGERRCRMSHKPFYGTNTPP